MGCIKSRGMRAVGTVFTFHATTIIMADILSQRIYLTISPDNGRHYPVQSKQTSRFVAAPPKEQSAARLFSVLPERVCACTPGRDIFCRVEKRSSRMAHNH